MATKRAAAKGRKAKAAIHDFLVRLRLIMHEANSLGLYATCNLLHEAVRKSGNEAAELMGKAEDR